MRGRASLASIRAKYLALGTQRLIQLRLFLLLLYVVELLALRPSID
jgi:hypothetical protein